MAQPATAFEPPKTGHVAKPVTVVLSEEMLVIVLYAVLTQVAGATAESPERRCSKEQVYAPSHVWDSPRVAGEGPAVRKDEPCRGRRLYACLG